MEIDGNRKVVAAFTTVHEVLLSLQNSFLTAAQWFKSLHAWHLHMFDSSVLSIPLLLYPYTPCWNQGCSHRTLVKLYKMLPVPLAGVIQDASADLKHSQQLCFHFRVIITSWSQKRNPLNQLNPKINNWSCLFNCRTHKENWKPSILYCCLKPG